MGCSELRTDVLCGRQSIISVERSDRPGAYRSEVSQPVAADPFAEGCESETPGEVWAIRESGTQPNTRGWRLRVVPNRYPIPSSGVDADDVTVAAGAEAELFPAAAFRGVHEVVIECPDLRTRLLELTGAEITSVFGAWRDRVLWLMRSGFYRSVAVFRNEGLSAGASLAHCHSQILATDYVPELLLERHRRSGQHRQITGRCLVMDLLAAEQRDGRRIIELNDDLAIWCPFAARTAWHVRLLLPGACSFGLVNDSLLSVLAEAVRRVARLLEGAIGAGFPFNLTLVQPRLDAPSAFPWFMDLTPRLTRQAGWELLSDIDVVPVAPEHCAKRLRELLCAGR